MPYFPGFEFIQYIYMCVYIYIHPKYMTFFAANGSLVIIHKPGICLSDKY